MSAYAVKKIDEMEAIYRGSYKRVRAELGVEAFGIQIIDLPANFDRYPEHDHAESGQEEVFLALRGDAEIEVDGERLPLDADHVVRVSPKARRKVWPGADGIRLLALGGTPGQPYEAPEITRLGHPDPMARS